MSSLPRLLALMLELSDALQKQRVRHALIGGMALAPRGYPRATRDIDFLVEEEGVERVRALMTSRHASPVSESAEFSSYVENGLRIDFQHARRTISREMLEAASPVEIADTRVPVLQAEDIIGLKVQAYHNNPSRLRDRLDIQELISANWGKLDDARVRSYFALFQREHELDDILRLVAKSRG